MSDRPTPETDAENAQFAIGGFTLDFCRKLERERDEARETCERYRLEANAMMIQRYEAIADRDIARLSALESDRAHDRMVGELEKVYKDLDKAREDATNYYARVGELEHERDDALSQIVQSECRAERFCQERDEARAQLKAEKELTEHWIEMYKTVSIF